MTILSNAKKHFLSRRTAPLSCIEVPEWGDDNGPAKVFYRPLNLAERARIDAAMQVPDKRMEAFAEALIVRALDADGRPLFKAVERTELLLEVDPDVIVRVITAMNADAPTDEELEKNL